MPLRVMKRLIQRSAQVRYSQVRYHLMIYPQQIEYRENR